MTPWLRSPAALQDDLGSVSSSYTRVTTNYNSRSRRSDALFWLLWELHAQGAEVCMYTQHSHIK